MKQGILLMYRRPVESNEVSCYILEFASQATHISQQERRSAGSRMPTIGG